MENIKTDEVGTDLRQSLEYGKYMEKIGWKVVKTDVCQVFIRHIGPFGIGKIQRVVVPSVWDEVNKILKKNRVVMTKLEPTSGDEKEALKNGFKKDGWPMLATKTLRVDLRPSEEKILEGFKKDCRYVLRKCLRLGLKSKVDFFNLFYEIWKKSSKRKGLWMPGVKEYNSLLESFGKKAFCITVSDLAGAVVLCHERVAYYYYAGATKEGNRLDLPYLVIWEAMKEAKKRKCVLWDFEGIYDRRFPNKDWMGFSHFKKSFEGKEIEFMGSYNRWSWRNLF